MVSRALAAILLTTVRLRGHLACVLYLLSDPAIVDMSQEGRNMQVAALGLPVAVRVWQTVDEMRFALEEGLPSNAQVLIPEQEEGSLTEMLGDESVSLLMHEVQSGTHLIVMGSNRYWVNRDVELIEAVTSWNPRHAGSGIECEDEDGRSVSRHLSGAGFGAGPLSLPYASAVYCMEESSLPADVDGLYSDGGESYAWTSPFGGGRVTHLGADYYSPSEAWNQLLEGSVSATCEKEEGPSPAACIVHLLSDPSIVDMSQEGANMQVAALGLPVAVRVWQTVDEMRFALEEGLPSNAQVLIPEQEEGSLTEMLSDESVSLLMHEVQSGTHLIVMGSNRYWVNRDVELIAAVTSWNPRHAGSGIECESEGGRSVSRDLSGAGFGAGPLSLPHVSAVYCMEESSLPADVDGLYSDGGESYAWTSPFGGGRVTRLGADYYSPSEAWNQLLEGSVSATCEKEESPSPAACIVHLLSDPSIVDMSQEGANMQVAALGLPVAVHVWQTVDEMRFALVEGLPSHAQVLIPEQEEGSLTEMLGDAAVSSLMHEVQSGTHLIVMGSNRYWVNRDVELIAAVTSWNPEHAGSGIECESEVGRSVSRDLSGAGFGAGPLSLPYVSAVYCMEESSLPADVDGLYSDGGESYAWTSPFGGGRVTHLGADYYSPSEAWNQLLEGSVLASCEQAQGSTVAPILSTSQEPTSTLTSTTSTMSSQTSTVSSLESRENESSSDNTIIDNIIIIIVVSVAVAAVGCFVCMCCALCCCWGRNLKRPHAAVTEPTSSQSQAPPTEIPPLYLDVEGGLLGEVQNMLNKTWSPIATRDRSERIPVGLDVQSVHRITNPKLLHAYKAKRELLKVKRHQKCTPIQSVSTGGVVAPLLDGIEYRHAAIDGVDNDINEVLLFHGTSEEAAHSIANEGFDLKYAGTSAGSMFGKGHYFAEKSSKSDEYAKPGLPPHEDQYCMLLCRVVLGEMHHHTQGGSLVHEAINSAMQSGLYDSVLGDRAASAGTYREFVVYNSDQVYPELLIMYRRKF